MDSLSDSDQVDVSQENSNYSDNSSDNSGSQSINQSFYTDSDQGGFQTNDESVERDLSSEEEEECSDYKDAYSQYRDGEGQSEIATQDTPTRKAATLNNNKAAT
jgi:hypothetical protein